MVRRFIVLGVIVPLFLSMLSGCSPAAPTQAPTGAAGGTKDGTTGSGSIPPIKSRE